jgi:hypothetical protein
MILRLTKRGPMAGGGGDGGGGGGVHRCEFLVCDLYDRKMKIISLLNTTVK